MAFGDFLTQTITRRRVALTPDTGGGYTTVNTDITFDGLIVLQSSGKGEVGGRDAALGAYRLYYPPTTDILSSDIIIDPDLNEYDPGVPRNAHELDQVGQIDLRLKKDKI